MGDWADQALRYEERKRNLPHVEIDTIERHGIRVPVQKERRFHPIPPEVPLPIAKPEHEPVQAAGILAIRKGLVLGVTRGTNYNDIGLPCGKVDGDETPVQAAIRECFEETGVLFPQGYLIKLYEGIGRTRNTRTYLLHHSYWKRSAETRNPALIASDEGLPLWTTWQSLLLCSYGDYNQRLYKAYLEHRKRQNI